MVSCQWNLLDICPLDVRESSLWGGVITEALHYRTARVGMGGIGCRVQESSYELRAAGLQILQEPGEKDLWCSGLVLEKHVYSGCCELEKLYKLQEVEALCLHYCPRGQHLEKRLAWALLPLQELGTGKAVGTAGACPWSTLEPGSKNLFLKFLPS